MTLEELAKRVQAIEDLEEIKKLHHDYIFLLCDKQYEQMLDFFTDDAKAQINTPYVCDGKEEIAKHFREVLANRGGKKGGSILIMPVITVDGDRAKGYWTMYKLFDDCDVPEIIAPSKWLQGKYDCEYVKQNGKWKFSYMRYMAWPLPLRSLDEHRK
jgi:ketosteroid isomerase-like protein